MPNSLHFLNQLIYKELVSWGQLCGTASKATDCGACTIWVPVLVQAAPFPIQPSVANGQGNQQKMALVFGPLPKRRRFRRNSFLPALDWPSPVSVAVWKDSEDGRYLSFSLCLCLCMCNSEFQINKWILFLKWISCNYFGVSEISAGQSGFKQVFKQHFFKIIVTCLSFSLLLIKRNESQGSLISLRI